MNKKRIRWDIELVDEFIKFNSDCILLSSEYKNTKNLLRFRCKCGNEFKTTFDRFKNTNKRQCNECSRITNWSIESIREFIEGDSGNGCTLTSKEYQNMYTKIVVMCECGSHFETNFTRFKNDNQRQCPECGNNSSIRSRRLSYEKVKDIIESQSGCELVSKVYKNNSTPLEVKCFCGDSFHTTLSNFEYQGKKQCGSCSGKIDWDYALVLDFVEMYSDCDLISQSFINVDTKMNFRCQCGSIFKTTFNAFRRAKRQCNECSGITNWDIESVKEYVSLNSESKVMSDDYKNMYQRLLFECSCGDTFNTTLLNFKESGKKRCGRCTGLTSNSELAVQEYLKDNSIDFISEYRFQDCRGAVNPLPFDFAVLNNEGNVKLLIEADGEGHYRPVNFGGCSDKTALKLFERTVRYDKIKTAYCKNNKIKLIRIPYWEFKNIDNYLKNAMP